MILLRATVFAALVGGVGWLCLAAGAFATNYYTRLLETRATVALDVLELDWARVELDGLVLSLTGRAPDPYAQELAYETLRLAVPSAAIEDRSSAALPPPPELPEPQVEMHRSGLGVRLSGMLADRALVAGLHRALAEEAPVLTVDEDLVRTGAREASAPMPFALAARVLGAVSAARVSLREGRLAVTGLVRSEEVRAALAIDLVLQAGPDVVVETELRVPPPVISPFAFSAVSSGNGRLRLERCAARSAEEANVLESRLAREGLKDHAGRCRVGLGGPEGDWPGAVDRGLIALGALASGRLVLHDSRLTVFADARSDPTALAAATAALETGLPDGFRGEVVPGESVLPETDDNVFTNRFWLSLTVDRTQVVLAGQMGDRFAVDELQALAAARFPGRILQAHVAVSPREAPADWTESALATLEGLAAVTAGHAELVPGRLVFEARLQAPSLARRMHDALAAALPNHAVSTRFEIDLPRLVDGEPLSGARCAVLLNRAMEGRPIRFAPGSAVLSETASGSLEAATEILRRCPDAPMEIGGHTDSQGSAELNRRLSLARARAVRDALEARAVPAQRLTAVGYGEDRPIASNDTPEGRARNRRIAFRVRPTAAGTGEGSRQ